MRFRALAACAAMICVGALCMRAPLTVRADDLKPPPTPSPYLIGRRGVETPEADALAGIAFRPFVPTRRFLLVALLAPFHGDDALANRGIGYEYSENGRLYALSQWPANGGSVRAFPPLELHESKCADVHSFPGSAKSRGIVWMTPRGIAMTLQPDGDSDAHTLQAEWRRIVRRGACR